MHYFLTASKDTTVYELLPQQNTGRDEVIEVSKTYVGSLKSISRALIKFDTNTLSSSIVSGDVTMSAAEMILRECESDEVPLDYTIFAHPISQSWQMGIGFRFDEISEEGATWEWPESGSSWLPSGQFSAESTGSVSGSGGVWYTASQSSQSFSYESADIAMNVLDPLQAWVSGTLPNNGFILKHAQSFEDNGLDYGSLKFFSKETNTIYQPKIRISWDDQVFTTGSLTELTEDDIHVTFKRLKTTYKRESTPLIRVFGREKYPLKTYSNLYSYTDIKFLPSTTYYQIRDVITDEVIIPFDDTYSKVSCDSNGNYFKLNLSNWETNRDYYIEIKTVRSGVVEIFSDKDLTFTVEK